MLPDSPWRFLLFFGEPNVKWCEAQFASWVTEPANTWSNLAFIVAGLVMLPFAKGERSLWLRLFGPSMLVLGVWSGLYHASFTFFFQVFDFLGMFLVLLCPLCIALERLGRPVARPVLTWLVGSLQAEHDRQRGFYLDVFACDVFDTSKNVPGASARGAQNKRPACATRASLARSGRARDPTKWSRAQQVKLVV